MKYQAEDGIFAKISGGFGSSVNLIRISCNFESINLVCDAFSIKRDALKPNFTFLSTLLVCGEFLDEALITYFKAPNSFTGEDCIEIGLHASPFIFEEVCRVLNSVGIRQALNGEFSYRAFLNGKIDLVEAEGIASLVASSTKIEHLASKRQFLGEASKVFAEMRTMVVDVMSLIESLIDFSDEELPKDIAQKLENKVNVVKNKILAHIKNTSIISLQEGLKIAIIGRPNSGKSSIFNRFCGREKAIVSNIAGTTRDVLEEKMTLKGVPVIFYDTAGMRTEASDEVEMEGIKRAVKALHKSDIKLIVKTPEMDESFEDLLEEFGSKLDENTIFVLNKMDIFAGQEEANIFYVSAKTGEGFGVLTSEIERILQKNFLPLIEAGLVATERQKNSMQKALMCLERFNLQKEIELASEDLRLASKFLEEILGRIDVEDVLGSIFSKFCIGK